MDKQDRQGVRTPADLERKYNFDKRFSEIMGIATDARDSVEKVESELRNEMEQKYSSFTRDTESIRLEVSKISENTKKTEEDLQDVQNKVSGIDGTFFYIKYSAYKDGQVMTDAPQEDTLYMGTCSTNQKTAPTDPGEYTWSRIRGKDGNDAILLLIHSSNGHMFKNDTVATTLTVEIMVRGASITSSAEMFAYFGETAKIMWQEKKQGEADYKDISDDDARFSDNGFIFTLSAEDLKFETVYNCFLDY